MKMVRMRTTKFRPSVTAAKTLKKTVRIYFSGSWKITGLLQPRECLDVRTGFRGGENGVFYTVLTDPSPFFTSVVAMEK